MTTILLEDTAHVVTACDSGPTCTIARGQTNHAHWPNGLHDGSGIDHEPDMLDYLRNHPIREGNGARVPRGVIRAIVIETVRLIEPIRAETL